MKRLLQDDNTETAPHNAGETERLPHQGEAPSRQSHVVVYHCDVYLAKTGETTAGKLGGREGVQSILKGPEFPEDTH